MSISEDEIPASFSFKKNCIFRWPDGMDSELSKCIANFQNSGKLKCIFALLLQYSMLIYVMRLPVYKKENRLKEAVREYFRNQCFYCGYPNINGIDHFLPIDFVVIENPEWWFLCCRKCNSIKYNKKFDSVKRAVIYIQNEIKKAGNKLFRIYTNKELQTMSGHFYSNKILADVLQRQVPDYIFLYHEEKDLIVFLNDLLMKRKGFEVVKPTKFNHFEGF